MHASAIFPTTRGAQVQRKQQKCTTKSTNKVKSNLKQIICRFCFYLTHIFEVSRFEVLISRFFWACFSKPLDLHVMGVGRSEYLSLSFVIETKNCYSRVLIHWKQYFLYSKNCLVSKNVGDNCSSDLRENLIFPGPPCHATHQLGNSYVHYSKMKNPGELQRQKSSSFDRVLHLMTLKLQ